MMKGFFYRDLKVRSSKVTGLIEPDFSGGFFFFPVFMFW